MYIYIIQLFIYKHTDRIYSIGIIDRVYRSFVYIYNPLFTNTDILDSSIDGADRVD